jgi:hypothetical protein
VRRDQILVETFQPGCCTHAIADRRILHALHAARLPATTRPVTCTILMRRNCRPWAAIFMFNIIICCSIDEAHCTELIASISMLASSLSRDRTPKFLSSLTPGNRRPCRGTPWPCHHVQTVINPSAHRGFVFPAAWNTLQIGEHRRHDHALRVRSEPPARLAD